MTARAFVIACALTAAPALADAQKLSIQGDRFAVDGVPRFLTFMTLFGAMGAPNITADLRLVRSLGFDGIRIWPNLDTGPQLMASDGTLRPTELARLRFILDQARLEHLVVDVSFTYEHTPGLDPKGARTAIVAAAIELRSYDNILFDIQNERNVQDRRHMSESDCASIVNAVRAVDSSRILVVSNSPIDPPEYAADFAVRLGLDATAYHEPRVINWYELPVVQSVVREMKRNGRPAYLQESMSTRDDLYFYPNHDRVEYFLQAIAHAKLSGAAAWCFHTDVGVDYRTGPAFLEDRLKAYPEPEWAFVTSLKPRIQLQTASGTHVVVAEGGGGAGVRADRTAAGPGTWDLFGIEALAGGPIVSGDKVWLTTADGTHLLQATGGGGSSLRADSRNAGSWETFRIEKAGGAVIHHGDAVTLRANDSPWYVVADGGGGGSVNVTSVAPAAWETFRVRFVTPHSTEAGTSVAVSPRRGVPRP
jgi:hypothetical protein